MKPNSISIFKSKSVNSKKGKFLSIQMYKYFYSCFRPTTFPPSFEKNSGSTAAVFLYVTVLREHDGGGGVDSLP